MDMYDLLLAKKLGGGGGGGVTVEELDVSANNTYTAPEGKAYSPVVVNVPQTTVTELNATANGTYNAGAGAAYNPVVVNVAGGASNVVYGSFTGTTANTAMDINLSYTGNGYPIAVFIWVSEGILCPGGTFAEVIQKNAIRNYFIVKNDTSTTPTYTGSGNVNNAFLLVHYKYSDSSATNYNSGSQNADGAFYDTTPEAVTWSRCVRIRSKTKMSVFIAGSSYGFRKDTPYTYCVVYSS